VVHGSLTIIGELRGTFLPNRRHPTGGVVETLLAAEREDPGRPLLRWDGGTWSVGDFVDRTRRWGGFLRAHGVRRGDRVAVMGTNSADLLAVHYGLYLLGAVEVSVNAELRGLMLQNVLTDSDPSLIVAEANLAPLAADARPGIPSVVLEEADVAEHVPVAPETSAPNDVAAILYTSGTTGQSKGVMLTHGHLPVQGAAWASVMELGAGDVFYFPLPFFHVDGHGLFPACLLSGSAVAFCRRFSVSRFWEDVERFEATGFIGVGSMFSALALRRPPVREHRLRFGTGAPMTAEARAYFEGELGISLLEVYGQTEANVVLATTYDRRRADSMGWPCTGFDVEIVDDHDEPVPPGTVGQLVYRPNAPHMVTPGYWRSPERTAESMRNLWWHSGDRARMDEDGFFYFEGRLTDSLRHRGENVSAWELEQTLNDAPGVVRSAAVGVRAELGGEDEIKVFVVLDDATRWDAVAFFAYCDEALPRFAVPRFVEPVAEDELVLSPGNGSIQKHLLPRTNSERTIDRLAT
jgi:crotonobetaine/carnitine-CoA ligase